MLGAGDGASEAEISSHCPHVNGQLCITSGYLLQRNTVLVLFAHSQLLLSLRSAMKKRSLLLSMHLQYPQSFGQLVFTSSIVQRNHIVSLLAQSHVFLSIIQLRDVISKNSVVSLHQSLSAGEGKLDGSKLGCSEGVVDEVIEG